MIKVVLWDVDGTLLDFEKAEEAGIRSCFKKYNLGECTDEMLEAYKNRILIFTEVVFSAS